MKAARTGISIKPEKRRVLLRSFSIGPEERISKVINRILSLADSRAEKEFNIILKDFGKRHRTIYKFFHNRYEQMKKYFESDSQLSESKKLLIGAYFTNEYSIESAALFNPSMIWYPDQSGLSNGCRRFLLSLRSAGEGHISSIIFTSGIIDENNNIHLDQRSKFVTNPDKIVNHYSSGNFDYEIEYSNEIPLSERIIFPYSPLELNGIEDARFVEFYDDNGDRTYYATFTAYDGHEIHSQILETTDFLNFKIKTLRGSEVKNKGMALFPRKINGKYAMISRQDNENIYIMYSDDLYSWNKKEIIVEPKYSWEFIQLGNCGSPIETDEGWILISHSVGAMRKYTIAAFLLDKENPSKMIGRLKKPLISSNKIERDGYVPNVVYSCGGLVKSSEIIIPYAMSDQASSFIKVNLNELLTELKSNS